MPLLILWIAFSYCLHFNLLNFLISSILIFIVMLDKCPCSSFCICTSVFEALFAECISFFTVHTMGALVEFVARTCPDLFLDSSFCFVF